MNTRRYNAVRKWSEELDGVFTISDLKVALDENSEATLYRVLGEMTKDDVLKDELEIDNVGMVLHSHVEICNCPYRLYHI